MLENSIVKNRVKVDSDEPTLFLSQLTSRGVTEKNEKKLCFQDD